MNAMHHVCKTVIKRIVSNNHSDDILMEAIFVEALAKEIF